MSSLVAAALAVREAYASSDPVLLDPALRAALDELAHCDPTELSRARARRTDPATSHTAGGASSLRAGSQRARLLHAFTTTVHADLTADEAHALTAIPATACYWKRISELAAGGFIEPAGKTRAGRAGEQQTAYRITDRGRAALHALWEAGR